MGFIGSNFIRYMLSSDKDIEVINLDSLSSGSNPNNLKDVKNNRRYKFIKGSINNLPLVSKLVKEVDMIVNFAAETHVDRSISNPKPFFESNTLGTFSLLEAAKNCAVRFLQVSTDEVYGDITKGSFREEDRLRPSNPYSASKAAADEFVFAYHRTYGLDALITRSTNNFGPYQFPEKLVPKTILRASMGLKIPIYGSGKNVRDWIYVLDHCEALRIVLEKGKSGEIYNISSHNEYENIEVVRKILELMGKDDSLIEFVEDRPGHDIRYSLDSSKLNNLGWRPKYDFEKALEQTVKWYLENKWWWKPIVTEEVLHPTPWKLDIEKST